MKTPYVPHLFGESVHAKLTSGRSGWFTAGVVTSIPWPQEDVWLLYDGHEYVLRGTTSGNDKNQPCISTPCARGDVDAATTRVYLFASVLGWFKRGYVDITGSIWGSGPFRYGSRETFATTLDGTKYFDCNYLPIIEDDNVRKALAFMREGRRLRNIHEPYAFLSFFKVVESQFTSRDRMAWFGCNLDLLDGDAAKRVEALRNQGVDVSRHLFDSGRCAVAHASLGGAIVDPDIPADRRRIAEDMDVMAGLAARFLQVDAGVPDSMELYRSRDRTVPWHALLPADAVRRLQAGEGCGNPPELGQLEKNTVSVRLWPHEAPDCMRNMHLAAEAVLPGVLLFLATNERRTVFLRFALDIAKGRVHTMLEDGGLTEQFNPLIEAELEHYTRYFHSVVGNSTVELCIDGYDPVPCEVVIPVNIIPQAPEKMVALALEQFRLRKDGATQSANRTEAAESAPVELASKSNASDAGPGAASADSVDAGVPGEDFPTRQLNEASGARGVLHALGARLAQAAKQLRRS